MPFELNAGISSDIVRQVEYGFLIRSERSCGNSCLEKLLASEVLEIRVLDPALTHAFVG